MSQLVPDMAAASAVRTPVEPIIETTALRIAILGSRGFPSTYGGYETFVRHAASSWAAQGHDVTVYCRDVAPDHGRRRTWEVDNVRCIWTPGWNSKSASTPTFGATSHLDAALRDFDVALVLNVANGFYLPLLHKRGIPSVLNTDGLEWLRGKWGGMARRVFLAGARCSTRYATVLVSDSVAVADRWAEQFGRRPQFIPYGGNVLPGGHDERVRSLGLDPRAYVLVVARLAPENNVRLTLEALSQTSRRRRAVVVGSANYNEPVQDLLTEMHQNGSVLWLGHVSDQQLLNQLWSNAGVYIHGHSVGGTNPALLQALGAGAPTLALDTPFNREVLRAEEQLYPLSSTELARRLEDVLDNPDVQARWSRSGTATVATRYRWDHVIDSYERAMREAITTGTKRRLSL